MWHKVRELQLKGLNKTQIGIYLGVNRKTVRRYLNMTMEEFVKKQSSHRKYRLKLENYEQYVRANLEEYPYISAARIHDWLKECYPDFPRVCNRTVSGFVERVRKKYGIGKKVETHKRNYEKQPDTPYGEYAQADFGEKCMRTENGKSIKVYFFAIVLSRSRYKFIYFSRRPFDTGLAVYAHELAFEYFGGRPQKIIYDQDKVLIARANMGDLILTGKFQAFVKEQHFHPVFCHKADPESKGRVENVVKYVKTNFLTARIFQNVDRLNEEARLWLERTGNGKEHGTTHRIPLEEFAQEREYLVPYHGTPHSPGGEMKEYHVRKDNTVQYRGNYYSLPCGTYRGGETTVWLHETDGCLELYNKETGKLVCRHDLCELKGKTIYGEGHRRQRNIGAQKLAERILIYVSYNREVALWLENLQRKKERYYRENLEVILRIIPGYDKAILTEAVSVCLDKGIYNGESVKSLCGHIWKKKMRESDVGKNPASRTQSTGLVKTYNEIFRNNGKV